MIMSNETGISFNIYGKSRIVSVSRILYMPGASLLSLHVMCISLCKKILKHKL